MSSNKVVNIRFSGRVQVLEFMHSLELHDVETIGKDAVWLALEQMFALVRSDV